MDHTGRNNNNTVGDWVDTWTFLACVRSCEQAAHACRIVVGLHMQLVYCIPVVRQGPQAYEASTEHRQRDRMAYLLKACKVVCLATRQRLYHVLRIVLPNVYLEQSGTAPALGCPRQLCT